MMLQREILLIQITISSTLNNTSRSIKIQIDVLTKETIKSNGLKSVSIIIGIIATCFMIYNYMNPDATAKTAAYVAEHTSTMLNRTNTLFRHDYGEVEDQEDKEVRDLPGSEKIRVLRIRNPASHMKSKEKKSLAKDGTQ